MPLSKSIEKRTETIIKLFDKYQYFAGRFHNEDCYFPIEDKAVCNCDLPKNKKYVKSFLITSLESIYKEALEEGRNKAVDYIKQNMDGNFRPVDDIEVWSDLLDKARHPHQH